MTLVDRFLKYVSFDTQSDESTGLTPSTPKQMVFAEYLKTELESLGLEDITLDEHGYLYCMLLNFGGNVGLHGRMNQLGRHYPECLYQNGTYASSPCLATFIISKPHLVTIGVHSNVFG